MKSFVEAKRIAALLVPLPHSLLRPEMSLPLACRVRYFRDQFPRGLVGRGILRYPELPLASGTDTRPAQNCEEQFWSFVPWPCPTHRPSTTDQPQLYRRRQTVKTDVARQVVARHAMAALVGLELA